MPSYYKLLAYLTSLMVYATISIGGYLTATNSGQACGTYWPTCNGQIFPGLTPAVLIEYTHRIVAAFAGLFFLLVTVATWSRFRSVSKLILTSTVGFALIVAQILLGMATVQSQEDPLIVAFHLALATAVFGVSVLLVVLAHQTGSVNPTQTSSTESSGGIQGS